MSTRDVGLGAAYEYTEKTLGGPVSEADKVVSTGVTTTQLVPPNADRVGLVIVNMGGGTVYVSMTGTPSASRGIVLSANGGSVTLALPFDFTLCSREFDAVSDASGPYNVYVLEYVRYRRGTA